MLKRLVFVKCVLLLIISGISCRKSTEKLSVDIFRTGKPEISVEKKTISEIIKGLTSIGGNPLSPSQLNEDKSHLNSEFQTTEIIKKYGYPVESYELVTSDGYIIEIQRIPAENSSHSPVLLQHGIAVYSSSWAIFPPNQSILFMLSKAGYDCWLGNLRGSPYGLKHKTLDSASKEFWDFGLEEMAIYDLSAVIDFILNVTQRHQLYYVGHSMGSTLGFILLSSKLEYNDKVKLFIAEAPIAYLHHASSAIVNTLAQSPVVDAITPILKLLNIFILPPFRDQTIIPAFCLIQHELCVLILNDISGNNPDEFSNEIFESFLQTITPNSLRTYLHYYQIYHAKLFQKYDLGALKNLFSYGQLTPPQFNVELITSPTIFYVGLNDHLSTLEDAKLLEQRLPNHVETYIVEDIRWTHVDFLSAIHSETALNKYLIHFLSFFDIIIS